MRFAFVLVLIGPTAFADPFDHGIQPSPQAETTAGEHTYELVDPGKPRRDHAKLFLAAGLTLWTVSLVTNLYSKEQWVKATHDPSQPGSINVDLANHYHDVVRYWGTGFCLAGVAAIGTAAYLYFTAEKDLVRRPIVSPMIGGDQAGVSVVGAF